MAQHIIVNITWQENYWTGPPSDEDTQRASHRYVRSGNIGHEYLNFDLERDVSDGKKIGFFQATRQPTRFSNGVGCVFFYSSGFIVGVYGRAEIGVFERPVPPPDDPNAPGNVRAPVEYVSRFEDIRLLKMDLERHLGGKKRIGQIGFTYIDDDAARVILDDAIALHDEGSEYRDRLIQIRTFLSETGGGRSVWKIAPGEGASYWDECLPNKCIAIGWEELGDYRQYATEEEIRRALGVSAEAQSNDATTISRFAHRVTIGDIVVANKGQTSIVGVGLITSEYVPPGDSQNPNLSMKNVRFVDWRIAEEVEIPIHLPIPTVMPLNAGQWDQIKAAYLSQNPALGMIFAEMEGKAPLPPVNPLFENIFKKARNVILYGPPGTGKTFQARRFADAWIQGQAGEAEVPNRRFWCVVASPKEWHWDILFGEKETEDFRRGRLQRNYSEIQPGDLIFGYLAHPNKELCCLGEIVGLPTEPHEQYGFRLKGVQRLAKPVPWQVLRDDLLLQASEPVRFRMQGTLFRFEPNEAAHLRELVEEENPGLVEILEGYWETPTVDYVRTVTFHQSYGYEDFIEGLRPLPDKQGNIRYEWRPGVFKQMCDDAAAEPENDFILIVDEINRGNIPKIFGELITLLEEDKRAGRENEMTVILPGSQQRFSVPDNLYVLGTMNTADRSIALLDLALRRRFTFVEIAPDSSLLAGREIEGIPLDALLDRLNARLEALLDRDHCLGHSYLMGIKDLEELEFAWYRKIIPLLQEYFYNDGERLQAVLDEFVEQEQSLQTVFSRPPDTFDPEFAGYRIVPLKGTQFIAALKRLAGVVQ